MTHLRRFLFAAMLLCSGPAAAEPPRVIDGDTFVLEGTTIRLWGIYAVERTQLCRLGGLPWHCGYGAIVALELLLAGQTVACVKKDTDRYGREVAACSISNGQLDVGALMVGEGWAMDYNQYSKGFYAEAQALAQANKRGIWSGEFEKPWDWRKRHP